MHLSIVIINRNSELFVNRLMETLIKSCNKIEKCKEIIIIDNASTDESPMLFEKYSKIIEKPLMKIIRLRRNYGFCYAANLGVLFARSELVAILNPDLYVDDYWLIPIFNIFEKHQRVGVVQPLICWYQYPERVQSTGLYADLIGNYKSNVFGAKTLLAPFGAAYVVRRDAFIKIGGLDSLYFMYGDELDLGLRMWLAGWIVVLEPASKVYHYMGGVTPSSKEYSILKNYLMRRNQLVTLLKILPLKYLFIALPLLSIVNIFRGMRSKRYFYSILAAYLNVIYNIRYIIVRRYQNLRIKAIRYDKLRYWGLLRPLVRA